MVMARHVILSAAKNLPSTRLYVSHMRFEDEPVRGRLASLSGLPCIAFALTCKGYISPWLWTFFVDPYISRTLPAFVVNQTGSWTVVLLTDFVNDNIHAWKTMIDNPDRFVKKPATEPFFVPFSVETR